MKKCNIVRSNLDFTDIIDKKQCVKDSNLVIYYNVRELAIYRFGVSVGKKIGNAVIRNKYKRRIRNIVDKHKNLYSNQLDYIIMVRKNCLEQSFSQIEESFLKLMNKINSQKGETYEKK